VRSASRCPVPVVTAKTFSYGRTIVDFNCRSGRPANCEVVVAIDAKRARAIFVQSLIALSRSASKPKETS
jgi:inosine-uridine nucleoside N-ribohydrolase